MKNNNFNKYINHVSRRFMQFQKEDRFFVIFLIILTIFILFLPIISMTTIGEGGGESLLIRSNSSLAKSGLIVVLALLGLLSRNISNTARKTLSTIFGFKENPFLLNFGLLWIILTSYIGIGDSINYVQNLTTRIQLTNSYYFTLLLLLLGLVFTLYLTIQQAKHLKHNKNLQLGEDNIYSPVSQDILGQKGSLGGLFGKLKNDEQEDGFDSTQQEKENQETSEKKEDKDTEESDFAKYLK